MVDFLGHTLLYKKILIDFVHNTITLRYIFDTLRKTFIQMPFFLKKERKMGIPILRGDLCREEKNDIIG